MGLCSAIVIEIVVIACVFGVGPLIYMGIDNIKSNNTNKKEK
jgi:hypothetical protein